MNVVQNQTELNNSTTAASVAATSTTTAASASPLTANNGNSNGTNVNTNGNSTTNSNSNNSSQNIAGQTSAGDLGGFNVGQPSVTLTIRLIMQGKEVGSIIGKKGDNIKKFREESGAKITISDGSCPERIVTVTGSTESILKAFAMIARKFEEDAQNINMVMGSHLNISNNSTAAMKNSKYHHQQSTQSFSSSSSTSSSAPVTLKLIVPASQCGSLIGKGGSKIKEIREITGASIQVASEMLPNSTERAVTLSGSAESITKSIYQICCVMLESPPKGPTIPYRPKPAMPPVFFAGGQAYTIQGQFAIPHPDSFNASISSSSSFLDSAQSCALQHQVASAILSQHLNQINHHYQQQQPNDQVGNSGLSPLSNSFNLNHHHSQASCSSPKSPIHRSQQLSSSTTSSSSPAGGVNLINELLTKSSQSNHHHSHHQNQQLSSSSSSTTSSNAQQTQSPFNGMLSNHPFFDHLASQYSSSGFLTKLHRLALQHAPLLPGQAVGSLNSQATLASLANSAASLGHHASTTNNPGMVPTLTTEMTISNDVIGSVIGKGGSKINEIR
ncbi:Mitochondrial 2-oxoglutarate/malate carrier protein [Sarcoptes scabiei]|nr:Mitochondrial 2-oxoglutarate/malate carrier protein [Sarcoptes scabiei]